MTELPRISIEKPVFAWMLMSAIIIFGAIGFFRLGVSQFPDVDLPIVSVNISLPGAAPEVMEASVLEVLEDSLSTITGVKKIYSSAKYGSGNLTLEFDLARNLDVAFQEVQTKVFQTQRNLPKDTEPPSVSKTNPEDQPIMWLAVQAPGISKSNLMEYARTVLQDRFAMVPGVSDVFLGGYSAPAMRVWLNPNKLDQASLAVSDLISTLQTESKELPSGRIERPDKEYTLRLMSEARTPEDFSDLRILTRSGSASFIPVRLGDVAKVEKGFDEVRRISRLDGVAAVGIGIRKQRGSNTVSVAQGIRKSLAALTPQLPKGMAIVPVFDSTLFIEESISELEFTLILAAILTGLVCWLFLGTWAATINVLFAIPTSIIGTFLVLYFCGFTLNTFTLIGLSLAIGIVVDDSIMVLENIIRHREMGKTDRQAALDGTLEIYAAAWAATLSIAAIFLPILFLNGLIGKFLFQFGVTITAAVLLSLLEAVTLTPMRSSRMQLKSEHISRLELISQNAINSLRAVYVKLLSRVLRHPYKFLGVTLILFGLSLGVVRFLKYQYLPTEDQSRFLLRLTTPVGTSLEATSQKTGEVEKAVHEVPGVTHIFANVGGFGGNDANSGNLFINLKDKKDRKEHQTKIMDLVREKTRNIPDAKIQLQDLGGRILSSGRGFPVEFTLFGGQWEDLYKLSEEWLERMKASHLFADPISDVQYGKPEIRIIPKRAEAALRFVSVEILGGLLSALYGAQAVTSYTESGRRTDVIAKLDPSIPAPTKIEDQLRMWRVRNRFGESVSLDSVASVERAISLQAINREDRQRAVKIFSNLSTGVDLKEATKWLEGQAETLPNGLGYSPSGNLQGFSDTTRDLLFALMLGIVVSYMILASQFNSFWDPLVILLSLPFSFSGAFVALWISKQGLNLYSFIGILLLMGIVKKNSILIVEFTKQLEERNPGRPIQEYLLEACPARLRPILLTSVTTVAGAIPAAIQFGPGSESRAPMAWAVIGGVVCSTALTLFVVPAFYSLRSFKTRRT